MNPEKILEILEKRLEHSMYCCWIDGSYHRGLECTCGVDEIKREVQAMLPKQDNMFDVFEDN